MYTHFKKAPATHKLGVLYVVDSVTRGWLDQARKSGQTIGPAAADGTFAAGVKHVTELLPSFMTDIINTAPEAQKVRFLEMSLNTIVPLDHTNVDKTYMNALFCCLRSKNTDPEYSVFRVLQKLTYSLRLRSS